MKSNTLISSIALIFLSLPATAQDQAKEVNMMIDVVAWGQDIQGLSLGKPSTEDGVIHAHSFCYGKPVKYQGSRLLAIYQSEVAKEQAGDISEEEEKTLARPLIPIETKANPIEGGIPKLLAERRKLEPNLVALVELPADSRQITLLLAPGAKGTFFGHVMDDDPTRFPAGRLRVHNLSSYELSLQIGEDENKNLKPQEVFAVETNGKFVTYRLAYFFEDKWKMQASNVLPLHPNEQCQMVILRSNNEVFLSSDGSRSGFMQMVILRRRL